MLKAIGNGGKSGQLKSATLPRDKILKIIQWPNKITVRPRVRSLHLDAYTQKQRHLAALHCRLACALLVTGSDELDVDFILALQLLSCLSSPIVPLG